MHQQTLLVLSVRLKAAQLSLMATKTCLCEVVQ